MVAWKVGKNCIRPSMLPSELICRGDGAVDSVDLFGHGGPWFESGLLWYTGKVCFFIVTLGK